MSVSKFVWISLLVLFFGEASAQTLPPDSRARIEQTVRLLAPSNQGLPLQKTSVEKLFQDAMKKTPSQGAVDCVRYQLGMSQVISSKVAQANSALPTQFVVASESQPAGGSDPQDPQQDTTTGPTNHCKRTSCKKTCKGQSCESTCDYTCAGGKPISGEYQEHVPVFVAPPGRAPVCPR